MVTCFSLGKPGFKFALISVCFLPPLGLAIFLLLSEIQGQIQFAQLEQQGLAYLGAPQQLQQTPEEIRHLAIADLRNFLGGRPLDDDITILILKQK